MSTTPANVTAAAAAPTVETPTATATDDAQRRILNRLKRARGQLNAVIEAVEAGGDCRTVVTQLAAVSSALDKAGFAIISSALRDCLVEESGAGASSKPGGPERLTVDELEKLFLTLS